MKRLLAVTVLFLLHSCRAAPPAEQQMDYGMSRDFAVHHIVHGKGKYHLENVANLGGLPAAGAWLVVAPIKIENGTGGPARIFALIAGDTR